MFYFYHAFYLIKHEILEEIHTESIFLISLYYLSAN